MNGVGRVVRFNWPRYAAGLATAALCLTLPVPALALYPIRFGAVVALAWIATSLAATWWVYDHKPLYDWRWLTGLLPGPPAHYAVVSAGLDEISPTLRRRYPTAEAVLLDLYDPRLAREGSIRRARALVASPSGARPARPDALPVPDGALDAVFVVFAAHELRTLDERRSLFSELARTLRPGGSLLLVEHCRDVANVAVYGPGAWHFYPRGQWLRLGRDAGLVPVVGASMTPLVQALAYRR
jgi:SAM-dependent methyltransferase